MKSKIVTACMFIALMSVSTSTAFANDTPVPITPVLQPSPHTIIIPLNTNDFELRMFLLINAERVIRGLPPFIWHYGLASAARVHSEDLAYNNIFGHIGSDGSDASQRLFRAGVRHVDRAENISGGQNSPEAVLTSWMSPYINVPNIYGASLNIPNIYLANILSEDLTHLGVGFVEMEDSILGYYVTLKFGTLPHATRPDR